MTVLLTKIMLSLNLCYNINLIKYYDNYILTRYSYLSTKHNNIVTLQECNEFDVAEVKFLENVKML